MELAVSLLVALFCMAVVFLVLAILYVLIRVISVIIGGVASRGSATQKAETEQLFPKADIPQSSANQSHSGTPPVQEAKPFSAGEINLNNVDAKTAAMLMAIVSHESGIPLSNLRFKSVKLIDNE